MAKDDKSEKPVQLTQNTQIDIQTLAAALRLAVDPVETAKLQRLQEVEGKPQVRISAVSVTGARFTVVIEEGRNKRTRELEQVIKTLENYEYPWSPVLELCAENYTPPLKWWKNPEAQDPFLWGNEHRNERGGVEQGRIEDILHPLTKQLNTTAKQHLYDSTWKADLRTYVGLTVAQGGLQGLREVKKAG